MDVSLFLTIVASVAGATWALRSKLSDIEVALRAHVESDAEQFKAIGARVVKLEARRGKR